MATQPGRPPHYKPDHSTVAYRFCLLGATNEDLAELFQVARGTSARTVRPR
jgi:hypothetical protein